MKKIALCMIVKDEAKTIIPCLTSAILLVDHVFVVDTGSTDNTKDVIGNFLAKTGMPYDIMNEPFRDFAYNRTFALEQLRMNEDIDYALVMDADDLLAYEPGFDPKAFKASLTHEMFAGDLYDVKIQHSCIVHHRPQFFKNKIPFTYKGVLHEYLEIPAGYNLTRATINGFSIHASTTGSRSRDPKRFEHDAEVLELALKTETDPFLISRYTFYLAQSYRDCGEKVMALDAYNLRAKQGYWVEEQYVSLLEASKIMLELDYPVDKIPLRDAFCLVPTRAEAPYLMARYSRLKGHFHEGYSYAKHGVDLKQPNGLFIEPWVYDYGIKDEFAVCAYYTGHYKESLEACMDLLCSDKTPQDIMKRVALNARFASIKAIAEATQGS